MRIKNVKVYREDKSFEEGEICIRDGLFAAPGEETENSGEQEETLDQTFGRLEELVGRMEAEDISLEESFALYHKGMDLLKSCNDKIDKIEKKMLILDEEGETHEFEQ